MGEDKGEKKRKAKGGEEGEKKVRDAGREGVRRERSRLCFAF